MTKRGISAELKALQNAPPWGWPPSAARTLLRILQDEQAADADRLLATELAGDFAVIDNELVAVLLENLRSTTRSAAERGRAAIALGPILDHADAVGFARPDDVSITEPTFHRIQETLYELYRSADVPTEVRRRVLEASVRAAQDWHSDAIRAAFASDDPAWQLTAVFCTRFVPGFDAQIVAALGSRNPEVHYEAVLAAGIWEVDAAWSHIAGLLGAERTAKDLQLAAIEAAASIRPYEAVELLEPLLDSGDEDIIEAVEDALVTAQGFAADADDDDDRR